MRNTFRSLVASVVILSFGATTAARAQTIADYGVSSTTTIVPLATTAGVIVLIVFLVRKPSSDAKSKGEGEAVKAAQLFLEQNRLQLAQDINAGHGPLIDSLASAMQVRPKNQRAFGELVRAHRADFFPLVSGERISEGDAREFAQKLVEVLESDAGMRGDLHAFAATAQVN